MDTPVVQDIFQSYISEVHFLFYLSKANRNKWKNYTIKQKKPESQMKGQNSLHIVVKSLRNVDYIQPDGV